MFNFFSSLPRAVPMAATFQLPAVAQETRRGGWLQNTALGVQRRGDGDCALTSLFPFLNILCRMFNFNFGQP